VAEACKREGRESSASEERVSGVECLKRDVKDVAVVVVRNKRAWPSRAASRAAFVPPIAPPPDPQF
jgi:hypothetical protein